MSLTPGLEFRPRLDRPGDFPVVVAYPIRHLVPRAPYRWYRSTALQYYMHTWSHGKCRAHVHVLRDRLRSLRWCWPRVYRFWFIDPGTGPSSLLAVWRRSMVHARQSWTFLRWARALQTITHGYVPGLGWGWVGVWPRQHAAPGVPGDAGGGGRVGGVRVVPGSRGLDQ